MDEQLGDTIVLADVPRVDVSTVTLGEMAQIEMESGRPFAAIMSTPVAAKMAALWIWEHRTASASPNGAPARSWRELSNLRPRGKRSSTSLSISDGPPAK